MTQKSAVLVSYVVVTVDPGSKPDKKYAWRRDMQRYVRKNFDSVQFTATSSSCELEGHCFNFMTVFIARSSGYNDTAALLGTAHSMSCSAWISHAAVEFEQQRS